MDVDTSKRAARREAAWREIRLLQERHPDDDYICVVGSLAHGGFEVTSDIDLLCVTSSAGRALEVAGGLGLPLDAAGFASYREQIDHRYCILNCRLEMGGIPVSCVVIDLACLALLADGEPQMTQVRNYIPSKPITVRDYAGATITLPREQGSLGPCWMSNYINFVQANGVWAQGSLVNKWVAKPVPVSATTDSPVGRAAQLLVAKLYALLRSQFAVSRAAEPSCDFMNPLVRHSKFDQVTRIHIAHVVYGRGDDVCVARV